ncbi:MAG: nucleotidyltransferase family protein [Christensenellales bacterium]|jgi:predicted nucleotidyltransferase
MRIAGIISEYNPFHNGHARHIALTRAAGYTHIVCAMNGHISQRGELTPASKWTRARAALLCGADVVIELPALFGCRTADRFADAGVRLLHALGVDAISFGSESGDLRALTEIAKARAGESAALKEQIAAGLSRGETLARARGAAEAALGIADADARPNDILAAEYIRALMRIDGAPEAFTVRRSSDYHGAEVGEVCSASAIRAAVARGDAAGARIGVPVIAAFQIGEMGGFCEPDALFLHALRVRGAAGIALLPDISEGIENRAARAAREAGGRADFIARVKCKRYTHARISRIAAHALIDLSRELAQAYPEPRYIRVIGMRADAAALMRALASRARLPILRAGALTDDPCFALECRATDAWALSRLPPTERRAGQEFTRGFVRVT